MSVPSLDFETSLSADFSRTVLEKESPKSPKEYRKSFSDSVANWDQLEVCVFCQIPVSPRRRTRIVKKQIEPNSNLAEYSRVSTESSEYSCNNCAQKIASYTFVDSPDSAKSTDNFSESTVIKPAVDTPRILNRSPIRRNSIESGNSPRQSSPLTTHRQSTTDLSTSDSTSEEEFEALAENSKEK